MMAIIIDSEDTVVENEAVNPVDAPTNITVEYLFQTGIFRSSSTQYLDMVKPVFKEAINIVKKDNPNILKTVYPTLLSNNIFGDERVKPLVDYVARTGWEILNNQGYDMDKMNVFFLDMFCQEHHKYSGHDTHTHPGAQITGFYFIEVPPNSCRVVFQDPRQAKYHASLMQRDMSQVTLSSNEINFEPNAGDFFFTNSWLPHSFTRNANVKPMKFIHFSLGVGYNQ